MEDGSPEVIQRSSGRSLTERRRDPFDPPIDQILYIRHVLIFGVTLPINGIRGGDEGLALDGVGFIAQTHDVEVEDRSMELHDLRHQCAIALHGRDGTEEFIAIGLADPSCHRHELTVDHPL